MRMKRDGDSGQGGSVRARDRLVARVMTARLDNALATGAPPDSTPALALRAEALRSPRMRHGLGQALERLLVQRSGKHPPGPRVSPSRERLDEARGELRELARRLRVGHDASARGVARARQLISDGAGPLFWDRSDEDLKARVQEAIAAL